jgi:hypothetical protein
VAPGVAPIPANPKIFGAQYAADLQIFYSHSRAGSSRFGREWHQTSFTSQGIESVAAEKTIDTSRT